jgi:hypothetical protein
MVELWSNHKKKQDYIIDIQNIQLDFQKCVLFIHFLLFFRENSKKV